MTKRSFKCVSDDEASAARVGPPDTKLVGSRERAIQRLAKIKRLYEIKTTTLEKWEEAIKEAELEHSWEPLGYSSLDEMLQTEIGETALDATLKVASRAEAAEPLAPHGAIGRGRGNRDDNVTSKRGNQADYLTSRIARDRPDILERMKDGEFSSVRQAAIAAGIVKVKTPAEQAIHWLKKCTDEQWNEVMEWIAEQ